MKAVVAVIAAVGLAAACNGSQMHTVEGTVGGVDWAGIAIAVRDGNGVYTSLVVGNGVTWQGADGTWHDKGQPGCLPPLSAQRSTALSHRSMPAHRTLAEPHHPAGSMPTWGFE